MKIKFTDKWLSKEEKAEIKKALIQEKEEMDSTTLYVNVDYIKVKAEWIDGNQYTASVYH